MTQENKASTLASEQQMVGFSLGPEEYGVDILRVQEIIRMQKLTRMPNMPDYVDGVINLRGKVIPVVDLRRRLGMPEQEAGRLSRIIVVNVRNLVLGFVVDSVDQVFSMPTDSIEEPPKLGSHAGSEYVTGVGKAGERLMLLLDMTLLMDDSVMAA